MTFVNERTELGKLIAIDRDRNLTLAYIDQMGRERIWFFEFSVNEKALTFQLQQSIRAADEDKMNVVVKWSAFKIKSDNWDLWPKFSAEMVEALKCFGAFGAAQINPNQIKDVIVEGVQPNFPY